MAVNDAYVLNTVSGIVQKVDRRMLVHPTFAENLIEVDDPNVCIACGDQPKSVVTTDGEVIDLTDTEAEDFEGDPELDVDPEEEN